MTAFRTCNTLEGPPSIPYSIWWGPNTGSRLIAMARSTMSSVAARTIIIMCCVSTLCAISAEARERDDSSGREFLRDYAIGLGKLERLFAEATGSATLVTERADRAGTTSGMRRSLDFATKAPHMAKVIIREGTVLTYKSENRVGKRGVVFCYNRDYSFRLSKDAGATGYTVESFQDNTEGQAPAEEKNMIHRLRVFLCAPYSLYLAPISRLLSDKDFVTRAVSRVDRDQRKMVKVDFELKGRNQLPGYTGWMIVSPEEGWILHEYQYKLRGSGAAFRGVVEYGDSVKGARLPKRVEHRQNSADGRSFNKESAEFLGIEFNAVPDSEFGIEGFGLPDFRRRQTWRLRGGYAPWMIGTSLLLMISAIVLRTAGTGVRAKRAAARG